MKETLPEDAKDHVINMEEGIEGKAEEGPI